MDASRLKSIPLFEDVPDEELGQIATFAQEVTVDQGRELVREGDFSYEFMAIEEGEAEVTRHDEHVADLGPGDFFGEMGLLEKTLRNATVTAKTSMKLVTLTGWDLKRMERHIPEAIERVRNTLEERRPADRGVVAARIVLFGATGYTGRLAAEAMIERGLEPVLAARSQSKLDDLVAELGADLETTTADVSDPPSVAALVERGDVLVTTVGPFSRWGGPAAAAATTKGAHYIDSTGEPQFIREVFERYAPPAEQAGIGMLTAMGYDWVPGNLAGALALDRAGELATRVDVGYFITGGGAKPSGGTAASMAGAIVAPAFGFRDGKVQTERGAKRVRSFQVRSKDLSGISVGSSEHFTLPRLSPRLREVNAYLGWFGPASRGMQALSVATSVGMKVPGAEKLWSAATERFIQGSTGGPDEAARAKSGSHIVGIAYDSAGRALSEVHLEGVDGYTFTGRMLSWAAERAATGGLKSTGALGPVDGFGLEQLTAGVAEAGLSEEPSSRAGGAQSTGGVPANAR